MPKITGAKAKKIVKGLQNGKEYAVLGRKVYQKSHEGIYLFLKDHWSDVNRLLANGDVKKVKGGVLVLVAD
jgi:hypothetical protein